MEMQTPEEPENLSKRLSEEAVRYSEKKLSVKVLKVFQLPAHRL